MTDEEQVDNKYYAQILSDVALLLQIKGANRYKIRAYQNASRAIGGLNEPVEDVLARDELTDIDGVGKSIASDIAEIKKTGTCEARTDLLDELDPGLLDLLKIQGMGAKKVKTLYDELDIKNIQELKEAAENQKIRELDGFGKKTEEKFLAEIERLESDDGRTPLPSALVLAESFRDELADRDDVERIEIARRLKRYRSGERWIED